MTLKTMPQPRFWAEDFHVFFDDFALKPMVVDTMPGIQIWL